MAKKSNYHNLWMAMVYFKKISYTIRYVKFRFVSSKGSNKNESYNTQRNWETSKYDINAINQHFRHIFPHANPVNC